MKRILAIAAGRRAKWIVVAVWVAALLIFSALQFPTKFEDVQKNDSASYLSTIGKKVWWPSRLAHEGEPGEHVPEPEPDVEPDAPPTL